MNKDLNLLNEAREDIKKAIELARKFDLNGCSMAEGNLVFADEVEKDIRK